MLRRPALLAAAAVLAGSAVPARAALPTPPGQSRGTAVAESVLTTSGFGVTFLLTGSLRLGVVTRHGRFAIQYHDGNSSSAGLYVVDAGWQWTKIGTCSSVDSLGAALPAPAAAVIRCKGHFPEGGADRSVTLSFAMTDDGEADCRQCTGEQYSGRYVG